MAQINQEKAEERAENTEAEIEIRKQNIGHQSLESKSIANSLERQQKETEKCLTRYKILKANRQKRILNNPSLDEQKDGILKKLDLEINLSLKQVCVCLHDGICLYIYVLMLRTLE